MCNARWANGKNEEETGGELSEIKQNDSRIKVETVCECKKTKNKTMKKEYRRLRSINRWMLER